MANPAISGRQWTTIIPEFWDSTWFAERWKRKKTWDNRCKSWHLVPTTIQFALDLLKIMYFRNDQKNWVRQYRLGGFFIKKIMNEPKKVIVIFFWGAHRVQSDLGLDSNSRCRIWQRFWEFDIKSETLASTPIQVLVPKNASVLRSNRHKSNPQRFFASVLRSNRHKSNPQRFFASVLRSNRHKSNPQRFFAPVLRSNGRKSNPHFFFASNPRSKWTQICLWKCWAIWVRTEVSSDSNLVLAAVIDLSPKRGRFRLKRAPKFSMNLLIFFQKWAVNYWRGFASKPRSVWFHICFEHQFEWDFANANLYSVQRFWNWNSFKGLSRLVLAKLLLPSCSIWVCFSWVWWSTGPLPSGRLHVTVAELGGSSENQPFLSIKRINSRFSVSCLVVENFLWLLLWVGLGQTLISYRPPVVGPCVLPTWDLTKVLRIWH